jgi:FdhD protein
MIHNVSAIRVSTGRPPVSEECRIVAERPVTLTIEDVGDYTLMCTPSDQMALAVGFAFTEGMIAGLSDIDLLQVCEDDANTIRVRLSGESRSRAGTRNLIVASSCGLCGLERVDEILDNLGVCRRSLRVSLSRMLAVHEKMRSLQTIFRDTGGTHAAAIFTSEGEIASFAEDIGRHNALDKAIGKCLLSETPTAGCGLAFSGRASFEIVVKAAKAGIEVIAAVSAPSSLAAQTAERCGITLCGFVRDDRATIYTHASRVVDQFLGKSLCTAMHNKNKEAT